ncbi:Rho GTPase activation protein [Pilobolus umbonatus]|nr:Rho GTPase activation protein [Pilobolus umbonatus]
MHFEWEGYTVHDAANVMRRFINHLPEPVITVEYQSLFKSIVDGSFPSIESKVGAFHTLIEQLPVEHQHLLLYLLDMLYMFSLHSDKTLMDRSALATSFSPGILLNPSDSMNPAEYKEAQRTLEFLIAHQHKFTVPTVISDQHLYRDQCNI